MVQTAVRPKARHIPKVRTQKRESTSLLVLVLPIVVVGGLALLHLVALARLSELDSESRRLDRLCQEQTARNDQLSTEYRRLVSQAALWKTVQTAGLVSPKTTQAVAVGCLPPQKVYWRLPGETTPTAVNGTRVGLVVGLAPTGRDRL